LEKQVKKVYKVIVKYGYDHRINNGQKCIQTGHWVLAHDEKDALKIANNHKIGNPMGLDNKVKERYHFSWELFKHKPYELFVDNFTPFIGLPLNLKRRYPGGSVWCESGNGKLIGLKTPLKTNH
jgi:hypothetical protein